MLIASVMLGIAGCGSPQEKKIPVQQEQSEQAVYTCPMHHEVISDKPGDCPKCGMALVKKSEISPDSVPGMQHDSMEHMHSM